MELPRKERRKTAQPTEFGKSAASDRVTKQLIVYTVCIIGFLLVFTICRLALNQAEVPDSVDRLANIALGSLIGWLGKTGVDMATAHPDITPPTAEAIGQAVTDAAADQPVKTDVVHDTSQQESD